MLVLLVGCAAGSEGDKSVIQSEASPPGTIVKIAASELSLATSASFESFAVRVRQANKGDAAVLEAIQKRHEREGSRMLGLLGGELLVGAAYAYPGAQVLAPFVIIGSIWLQAEDTNTREAILRALGEVALVPMIQADLELATPAPEPHARSDAIVEVIVLQYGVVAQHPNSLNRLCLVARAALTVDAGGRRIFDDLIYIEPYVRSSDAPPPVCGTPQQFALDDARAVRRGLVDYAQVLAAIAVRRTRALPWRSREPSQ